eukprot:220982_1
MNSLRNFSLRILKYTNRYNMKLLRNNIVINRLNYRTCQSYHRLANTIFSNKNRINNTNFISLYNPSIYLFSTSSPLSTPKLPFKITDASCKRINFLKEKRNENDLMLRVGVSSGGCSGFSYEFEFSNPSDIDEDDDIIFTKDKAQFVVDKTSLKFIKGAKLDFVEDFIQTSFVLIDNPNIVSECGCNVSFTPNPELLDDDDDDDDAQAQQ